MSYPPAAAGVTGGAPGALASGGSESLKITKSSRHLTLPNPLLNDVLKHHVHTSLGVGTPLLPWPASQPPCPKPLEMCGVVTSQEQHPAPPLVEMLAAGCSPLIQPTQSPLHSFPSLLQTRSPSDLLASPSPERATWGNVPVAGRKQGEGDEQAATSLTPAFEPALPSPVMSNQYAFLRQIYS